MRNDERDALDRLLDDALAAYSRQEPRPGLEQRVLNHIRAGSAVRRFRWRRLAVTIPVAAGLLWVGVLWMRQSSTPERPPVTARVVAPAPPETPRMASRPHATKRLRAVARRRRILPKQPEFPAPVPVSNEERALLAFVEHSPKLARETLLDTRQQGIAPIRIEEIKIQPLQSDWPAIKE
jgi:hypothetical protein